MIKYRTIRTKIEAVEIIRETPKQVVLKPSYPSFISRERREAKRSDYQNWFDTWEEAKSFLVDEAKKKVALEERNLKIAKARLNEVSALEKK